MDETCHFLRLPAEIRNHIYSEVDDVRPDLPFFLELSGTTFALDDDFDRVRIPQTRLLAVCKHIRDEVLPIFYGSALWTIDNCGGEVEESIVGPGAATELLWCIRRVVGEFQVVDLNDHRPENVQGQAKATGGLTLTYPDSCCCRKSHIPHCGCVFEQRAREADAGTVGSPDDPPVVRFFKSWAASPSDDEREKMLRSPYKKCEKCGQPETPMWLKQDECGTDTTSRRRVMT